MRQENKTLRILTRAKEPALLKERNIEGDAVRVGMFTSFGKSGDGIAYISGGWGEKAGKHMLTSFLQSPE